MAIGKRAVSKDEYDKTYGNAATTISTC
jgi:hypothetical protein